MNKLMLEVIDEFVDKLSEEFKEKDAIDAQYWPHWNEYRKLFSLLRKLSK